MLLVVLIAKTNFAHFFDLNKLEDGENPSVYPTICVWVHDTKIYIRAIIVDTFSCPAHSECKFGGSCTQVHLLAGV